MCNTNYNPLKKRETSNKFKKFQPTNQLKKCPLYTLKNVNLVFLYLFFFCSMYVANGYKICIYFVSFLLKKEISLPLKLLLLYL